MTSLPDDASRVAALPLRLAEVRARADAAARAAGRDPAEVRLLLAVKTMSPQVVRAAAEAGGLLLGHNRVQELVATAPALTDLPVSWHLIGPLQSNKVNAALRWVDCVQSVADLALARRLAERCVATDRELDVMVQVNVSGEPTKHGVVPDGAVALAAEVAALPRLHLVGLMTVGARSADLGLVRAGYARLRALRDEVLAGGAPGAAGALGLSMGMSGDLEAAVAEGATIVRLGSSVFGPRAG